MLARTDRIALAGRVGCDPRTVIAWVNDPQSVKRYLSEKLDEAAKDLEIDLAAARSTTDEDGTGTEG